MAKKPVRSYIPEGFFRVKLNLPLPVRQRLRVAAATLDLPGGMAEFCRRAALDALLRAEAGAAPFPSPEK
jgi:hypothetical protein